MSAELERLVALVTCANVYLQDNETKFNLDRTITEYCHGMEFIDNPLWGIAGSKQVIASDASKWFAYLKKQEGPKKVRLHYRPLFRRDIPDSLLAAFVGTGINWLIEIQYDGINCLYVNILNPRERGISQPWKTYFTRLESATKNLEDTSPSVNESREIMDHLLALLSNFTNRFEHTKHWADTFDRSRKTLEEFVPSESEDFIPNGIYSKEARQLLQAALNSWIFGGMGSWNDLAFSGENEFQYATLSRRLYEAICLSITSVINSYP